MSMSTNMGAGVNTGTGMHTGLGTNTGTSMHAGQGIDESMGVGVSGGEEKQILSISIARQKNSAEIACRVRGAIDDLILQGKVPSFYSVAASAHVARSTLYRNVELKELVTKARSNSVERMADGVGVRGTLVPEAAPRQIELVDAQRNTASLQAELDALQAELITLRTELVRMRTERDVLVQRLDSRCQRDEKQRISYYVCHLDEVA